MEGDVHGDTYLEFSKRWTTITDRGGLVRVSDETYHCIHAAELQLRKHLQFLSTEKEVNKVALVEAIMIDPDVQFYWSLVTTNLDEEAANNLLSELVQLWLTVRGFSMAGAFVEHHKQNTQTGTKKASGELKRKRLDLDIVS